LYDTTASNYLYGRQAMFSNKAWQRHGCYRLGSDQYFNIPLQKSLLGCMDDWNSLDHFDPTADSRRVTAHLLYLRSQFSSLQDGFGLVLTGNWTVEEFLTGSNGTETDVGLRAISRGPVGGIQNLNGSLVFMLFSTMNQTTHYDYDCASPSWVSAPFAAGTTLRNLVSPFENVTLQASLSHLNDSKNSTQGCLRGFTMAPFGYKIFVDASVWIPPRPALTKFSPGHDARVSSDGSVTTLSISFEFNTAMDCAGVTKALSLNMSSSGHGGNPTFDPNSVKCGPVQNPDTPRLAVDVQSAWSWSSTLQNVPDGILSLTLDNAPASDGRTTGV